MDAITRECFEASPIRLKSNNDLMEMVYNYGENWILVRDIATNAVIKDCRAHKSEFNECCKFLFDNKNYFNHLKQNHPNIKTYSDAVCELSMEKINE